MKFCEHCLSVLEVTQTRTVEKPRCSSLTVSICLLSGLSSALFAFLKNWTPSPWPSSKFIIKFNTDGFQSDML